MTEKSIQEAYDLNLLDREEISDRLEKMECCTYYWLRLMVDIFMASRAEYSNLENIKELLDNKAYEQSLSKRQYEQEVKHLLQMVLAAMRPLIIEETNFALTLIVTQEHRFASTIFY
jgi:hypothetical protein